MANLALPFMAIAGAYLLSNKNNNEDEEEDNECAFIDNTQKPAAPNIIQQFKNIPKPLNNMNLEVETVNNNEILLLNGDTANINDFQHNNAVPFFGGSIKGPTLDRDHDHILDHKVGGGSLHNQKKSQAPLFQPKDNISNINGAPNVNDYMQSRQVSSLRHANTKPWVEEKVQPGLNQGYTTTNSNLGYNSGVDARSLWEPKTVNELRTETNPKLTYNLYGHEGPLLAPVQNAATKQTLGKVEKHLPDSHYEVGPARWFTTTGDHLGQTNRSDQVLQDVNRPDTTVEYYGTKASGSQGEATYTVGEYEETTRQSLGGTDVINYSAAGQYKSGGNDYGVNGYRVLPNNRVTTENTNIFGNVQGLVKAAISPFIDILRPSRKENVIGNIRASGNVANTIKQPYIVDPNDRLKTTIKETTEGKLGFNHLNMQGQNSDGYLVTTHNPANVQRDTTNASYIGNAGPSQNKSMTSYVAGYNQMNNNCKTAESRPNPGGTQMFNATQNICISKNETDRNNNRMFIPSTGPSMVPSGDTFGKISGPEYMMNQNNNIDNRMDGQLLDAFKNNPYTHSLNSYY